MFVMEKNGFWDKKFQKQKKNLIIIAPSLHLLLLSASRTYNFSEVFSGLTGAGKKIEENKWSVCRRTDFDILEETMT